MYFKKVKNKKQWECSYKGVTISVRSKKHVESLDLYVGDTWFAKDLDKDKLFNIAREMFWGENQ